MMRDPKLRIAAFALVWRAGCWPPSLREDIAARTELHAIHTLTLSDKQFLTGDAEAKATIVSGSCGFPPPTGRLPVVVLMHGSGGMGPNIELWAREFNAIGIGDVSRSTASPAAG